MVPYCRNLIDVALLTEKERKWIDEYHQRVQKTLREHFEGQQNDQRELDRTMKWLEKETLPL